MRTTLEIPDDLFHEAESRAALTGTNVKDLVAEGLRLVLAGGIARSGSRRVQFPIIMATPGAPVIASQMVEAGLFQANSGW